MKKLLLSIFILVLSVVCQADVNMRVEFPVDTVTTGELVKVQVILDSAAAQSLSVQSLRGQTLAEKIYVQSMSPLLREEGKDEYTADAEIIFIKDPGTNELTADFNGQVLRLRWNNVHINVLETPKDYVLGTFEVPSPKQIMVWVLSILGIGLLIGGVFALRSKLAAKAARRNELREMKTLIQSCRNYEEVVELWQKKRKLLTLFPHLEEPLARMEIVLFKYQFKPAQTSEEQRKVVDAYRLFVKETEEGFHGI